MHDGSHFFKIISLSPVLSSFFGLLANFSIESELVPFFHFFLWEINDLLCLWLTLNEASFAVCLTGNVSIIAGNEIYVLYKFSICESVSPPFVSFAR